MKTILILASLLVLNSSAQARQYVVRVNHVQNIQPSHTALNTLLQKDITIDTTNKVVKVRLSQVCIKSNVCPEMLRFYRLDIKKMDVVDSLIQAEGLLPLQTSPTQAPGSAVITLRQNMDNATVIQIRDVNGTSTLIASPMQETDLLF